jgi:hypothetical protein
VTIFPKFKYLLLGSLCASAVVSGAQAQTSPETFSEALAAGKILLESRLRYEGVDQAALKPGHALTLRTRLGFESADFNSMKFLVEFEDVRALDDDYNSTTNGKTQYPTVADPIGTELNRFQVTWKPTDLTTVTAGRQRMILDDARFIGNAGWRQDEQTFDALKVDTTLGKFNVTYAYIFQVNRILAETADWDSDSHILNVTYNHSEALKVQAFNYLLDFENSKANSSNTLGVRATGSTWLSSVKLAYAAQYAKQKDYGFNPTRFDLSEYMLEGAATWDMFTFKVNYESLEGNGTRGFSTPLGTTHAFQGWSDVFATAGNKTLPDGINNLSYGLTIAGYTNAAFPLIKNPTLTIIHHGFETERTSRRIGGEWDIQATAGLTRNLSLLLKYADFERASPSFPASRQKFWFSLEYKL